MTDRESRERLIDLLYDVLDARPDTIADHLLANGVKIAGNTNLQGKCGSCIYAKPTVAFGKSTCYVKCTNAEHIERFCQREISILRQRTNPACKKYKEREGQCHKRLK